jgi:2-polyprenyl-3-methyl-5-hydroxy-6-metoxy-1,4-benzoquinol methylase
MSETYAPTFFARELDRARSSAETVVPLVMERVSPKSVLDLGCGHGIWLETFARHGVEDYIGVDGDWVPREALHFPADRFIAQRVDKPLRLERRFDLATSLEVAEHLPERGSRQFVRNIVEHASCVLFSAAIPHQRGTDHINEQWPDYWAALFDEHGYLPVDGIRPLIWSNDAVFPFYRQNILMFATEEAIAAHPLLKQDRDRTSDWQLSLVHPEMLVSVAAHPHEHVRRPTARELMLSELLPALPVVATRAFRWRFDRLKQRLRR